MADVQWLCRYQTRMTGLPLTRDPESHDLTGFIPALFHVTTSMSTRKKNTRSSNKKQQPISSYFSVKPKATAVSPPKRLVQSSLAVRPVRSRKYVVEDDDVLDLTRSTSPLPEDLDSPPSHKKRRTGGGPTERQTQSAHHTLFGDTMSPLTASSSPAPSLHGSRPATPVKLSEGVKAMAISPSSTPRRQDSMMAVDDPNEIVESSQTQYIHLHFTPPSHRTRTMQVQGVPAPVLTPPSHRSETRNQSSRAAAEDSVTPTPGPYEWRIPSSQGEMSEPRTPRKRSWAAINQSKTPSKTSLAAGSRNPSTAISSSSVASGSQGERTQMPPPILPASVLLNPNNNAEPPARPFPVTRIDKRPIASPSRVASLRAQSARVHPSSDDRTDHVPSSQGELSLAPTELGTMESPQRPAAYPSIDTDLLTTIPSSNPASQVEATSPKKQQPAPIQPVPRPDFAHPPQPRTPTHAHVVHRGMTSSPTNLPSPRALFESLGLGTQASVARPAPVPVQIPTPTLQAQVQDSPDRNDISSQTIIPSSQPMHDSSPPPEYDIDARMHSFNQAQMQQSQYPYPHPRSSQEGSSQSLPPSQSPLKNSRVDPDRSGAGMNGVFGMLGFGSEADTRSSKAGESSQELPGIQTPVIPRNLPPSSPPPETPPHVAESESQFGDPGTMAKNQGTPLLHALEQARSRGKTATPVKVRAGPVLSSPVVPRHLDIQAYNLNSPSSQRTTRSKAHNRSQSVGVQGNSGSTRPKRITRALRPTTPSQRTPLAAHVAKDSQVDFVGSSDAEEEAMELEARTPLLDVATSPARGSTGRAVVSTPSPTKSKGKGKENAQIPTTPSREERLPSSVSPSPIGPTRHSSPSPLAMEDTQTQDETETPWETLRPSQSVSQVLERRILEEAMAEAERGRALRAEQEAQREKERVEAQRKEEEAKEKQAEMAEARRAAEEAKMRGQAENSDKAARKNLFEGTSHPIVVPASVSTPKSRRVLDKEIYIVTPTKVIKRTPVKAHRGRATTMTPSSPLQEDEGEDDEYTYIDETFNPTESQRSFLNRIMNGSSEVD